MAKTKQKADTTTTPQAELATAAMQTLQDAGLGPMQWLGTDWFEKMSDINSEILSFVAERVREDVKTQHEILHCKTPEEVQEVQVNFLRNAYAQYTAESGKLMNMGLHLWPLGASDTKDTPV